MIVQICNFIYKSTSVGIHSMRLKDHLHNGDLEKKHKLIFIPIFGSIAYNTIV